MCSRIEPTGKERATLVSMEGLTLVKGDDEFWAGGRLFVGSCGLPMGPST